MTTKELNSYVELVRKREPERKGRCMGVVLTGRFCNNPIARGTFLDLQSYKLLSDQEIPDSTWEGLARSALCSTHENEQFVGLAARLKAEYSWLEADKKSEKKSQKEIWDEKHSDLVKTNAMLEDENATLEDENAALDEENARLKDKYGRLKDEMKEVRQELSKLKSVRKRDSIAATQQEEALRSSKQETDQLAAKLHETMSNLTLLEKKNKSLMKQRKHSEVEQTRIKEELAENESKLEERQQGYADLHAELNSTKEKLQAAEAMEEQLKAELEKTEEERSKLGEAKAAIEEQAAELRELNVTLRSELQVSKNENAQLQDQLVLCGEENGRLNETLNQRTTDTPEPEATRKPIGHGSPKNKRFLNPLKSKFRPFRKSEGDTQVTIEEIRQD